MDKSKENALMNCSSLDELLDVEFGKVGSETREEFDRETEAFCLAQTLKEERKRAGLTQEELAEKIGITQANLSILKTGKAKAVRFSTLEAICKALDCQPGDILEYQE